MDEIGVKRGVISPAIEHAERNELNFVLLESDALRGNGRTCCEKVAPRLCLIRSFARNL